MIMSTKEICKRGLSMTISLTLGNTGFPFADRGGADAEHIRKVFLRQLFGTARAGNDVPNLKLHNDHPFIIGKICKGPFALLSYHA